MHCLVVSIRRADVIQRRVHSVIQVAELPLSSCHPMSSKPTRLLRGAICFQGRQQAQMMLAVFRVLVLLESLLGGSTHGDREHIISRPRWEVNLFGHARKHGGNRTYLEMIGQSGSVLEYDAVHTVHNEFREAFPLYEHEPIVLLSCTAYGTYHAKSSAHTGTPHPNMSTIFMGKSSAEELE
jgi:hypothetical protein